MPVLYKAVQSTMPTEEGEKLWYPHLVKIGRAVTTHELAMEISKMSSLSPGDVHNVIYSLFDCMSKHLKNSRSVNLEELGTFTLKAQAAGNGVKTPEEVNPKQINYLKVQFTPSYRMMQGGVGKICPMVNGVEFEKSE